MKVLNIVKYYYPSNGGIETFARILSEGVKARDVAPTILTVNHQNCISNTIDNINGIQVYRVGCLARIMSQPITYSLGSKLKELVASHDLIHIHCPFPNAELYGNILTKKPLVVSWHADPVNTRWNKLCPLYKPIYNRILKNACKIIVSAPNMLAGSPSLQPFQDKCSIIPYSCRFASVGSGHCLVVDDRGEPAPIILFVGRLRSYKGVSYLIQAMAQVQRANLKIIGQGEEEAQLKRLVKKLGLQSRVVFLSNVTDEEMSAHYKSAHLFVLPSISPAEAFGIVQIEAMAFGLPVINTDLPTGVPFVSLHGVTGLTVPPKNALSLAQAINRLLENKQLYNTFSHNAFERSKEFTEDKMISSYLQIYDAVL